MGVLNHENNERPSEEEKKTLSSTTVYFDNMLTHDNIAQGQFDT